METDNGRLTVDPKGVPVMKVQGYLQGAVAPRPIALVSSIDGEGRVNLSPFSFFNVVSANPPILVFSTVRRLRDNTMKDTLRNVLETKEVVINTVSYSMVQQTSLSSTDYAPGENEFIKAGFTPVPSVKVKPPLVGEAAISFECRVKDVVELGGEGGAGNLVVCEVLLIHIKKDKLDEEGRIDPFKMDLVARMGLDWYCRAHGQAVFQVPKPLEQPGISFDGLPERIRNSKVLTGNDLGLLGNVAFLPKAEVLDEYRAQAEVRALWSRGEEEVHRKAQWLLEEGQVDEAWKLLLAGM